jgi:SNF2 family DNA or RNA helicase
VDTELTDTAAKTMALDALLHRLVVEEQEKVVLWSYYRATLVRLASRYDPYGVARIDGSITDVDDRRRAISAFQHDPSVRLFVGNPAAAGAGVTLHAARFAVYESMSNQAAHYLQSLDRIHRRGQGRAVEYFTLLSPGTVEISEYDRLKRKAAAQADLLGDPEPDRISREAMIEELTRLYPRERDS